MNKANSKIRAALEKHHMYGYQLAHILNVSESTYSRMMRFELPEIQQRRIVKIIEEHARKELNNEI